MQSSAAAISACAIMQSPGAYRIATRQWFMASNEYASYSAGVLQPSPTCACSELIIEGHPKCPEADDKSKDGGPTHSPTEQPAPAGDNVSGTGKSPISASIAARCMALSADDHRQLRGRCHAYSVSGDAGLSQNHLQEHHDSVRPNVGSTDCKNFGSALTATTADNSSQRC